MSTRAGAPLFALLISCAESLPTDASEPGGGFAAFGMDGAVGRMPDAALPPADAEPTGGDAGFSHDASSPDANMLASDAEPPLGDAACVDGDCAWDAGLDAAAPPVPFHVASFNLQTFGPSKSTNPAVVSVVAEVVRRYELIGVQEVKDVSLAAADTLLAAVNALEGPTYAMVESPRTGVAASDKTYQEQYVYYYDTTRVRSLDAGALFPDPDDVFRREPFVARFEVDGWDFALVNVHTQPDRAVVEIAALDDVAKWTTSYYGDELDVILLGDFNAGCAYASPAALDALLLRGPDYQWLVPDEADTNVAGSVCAYDRIVTTDDAAGAFTGVWAVEPWVSTESVSDHWPVQAEFVVEP